MEAERIAACSAIVSRVLRTMPRRQIGCQDEDDLYQELMIHALAADERSDARISTKAYVRTAVSRKLGKLYRAALAARRHPQNTKGMPLAFADSEALDFQAADEPTPEDSAAIRERLDQIASMLAPPQRRVFEQIRTGARDFSDAEVKDIRYQVKRGLLDG